MLNSLVETVRPTGMLGVSWALRPRRPGRPERAAKQGKLLFTIGRFFEKGLRMATGQPTSSTTTGSCAT